MICRFLQGPETDPATVRKIRDAIDNQTDVTVQLINYTKSGINSFFHFLNNNISVEEKLNNNNSTYFLWSFYSRTLYTLVPKQLL